MVIHIWVRRLVLLPGELRVDSRSVDAERVGALLRKLVRRRRAALCGGRDGRRGHRSGGCDGGGGTASGGLSVGCALIGNTSEKRDWSIIGVAVGAQGALAADGGSRGRRVGGGGISGRRPAGRRCTACRWQLSMDKAAPLTVGAGA